MTVGGDFSTLKKKIYISQTVKEGKTKPLLDFKHIQRNPVEIISILRFHRWLTVHIRRSQH